MCIDIYVHMCTDPDYARDCTYVKRFVFDHQVLSTNLHTCIFIKNCTYIYNIHIIYTNIPTYIYTCICI